MPQIVQSFFALLGLDIAAPLTMGELLPYLLTVLIGFCIILWFLDFFKYLASIVIRGGDIR